MPLPWKLSLALMLVFISTACHEGMATAPASDYLLSSPPSEGLFTKIYKVPDDYMYLLADRAYQKTGDPLFARPGGNGSTILWEPWPSRSLKKLGLQSRDGYSMALRGDGLFTYTADASGHRDFVQLNRSLGIPVRESREK